MNNINKIDALVNKLKNSKKQIEVVINENKNSELLDILSLKRTNRKSTMLKKAYNSLFDEYGYNFKDGNILDKSAKIIDINILRKRFLNSIKTKLLKSRTLKDGNIKNKKARYCAFLIDIESPNNIKERFDDDFSIKSQDDSNIKKGMGKF